MQTASASVFLELVCKTNIQRLSCGTRTRPRALKCLPQVASLSLVLLSQRHFLSDAVIGLTQQRAVAPLGVETECLKTPTGVPT